MENDGFIRACFPSRSIHEVVPIINGVIHAVEKRCSVRTVGELHKDICDALVRETHGVAYQDGGGGGYYSKYCVSLPPKSTKVFVYWYKWRGLAYVAFSVDRSQGVWGRRNDVARVNCKDRWLALRYAAPELYVSRKLELSNVFKLRLERAGIRMPSASDIFVVGVTVPKARGNRRVAVVRYMPSKVDGERLIIGENNRLVGDFALVFSEGISLYLKRLIQKMKILERFRRKPWKPVALPWGSVMHALGLRGFARQPVDVERLYEVVLGREDLRELACPSF